MENGPFEDVFPNKKMGILHCYVSLPEGSTVLQQHKLCRFTATLFNWNSYAEGVVGSTVRSSLVSGRPVGWVVALFWWNFFLNDLNCQKQKRSDICRWTLPDTFFIEHQYVMAKPDLKVGLTLDPNHELHWNQLAYSHLYQLMEGSATSMSRMTS